MRIKKVHISAIAALLIILLFANYLRENYAGFSQLLIQTLKLGNAPSILLLMLLSLLSIVLNGILLDKMVSVFGLRLRFKDSFGLAVVTRFYNYIAPFHGGMAVRAIYLKKVRNFPYLHFFTALSGIYVVILFIAGLTGMIASLAIWISHGMFNVMVFGFFSAVAIGTLVIARYMPQLPESSNRIFNSFIKLVNGWHVIKRNRKILSVTAVIACVQLISLAIKHMVVYSLYDIDITLFKGLYLSAISSLFFIVSLTPGNLGISEAISVFSATVIGISVDEAIAASILLRITNLLVVFVFGPIFSYVLFANNKKKEPIAANTDPKENSGK